MQNGGLEGTAKPVVVPDGGNKLSQGAIIAIAVVFGVVGVAIIATVIVLLLKKRAK